MYPYPMNAPSYQQRTPMIDEAFDRFEFNREMEESLRETEAANFYHNALELTE
jgi:hypothetical protein